MTTFTLIVAFGFGACIGSFLNVLIWRLPREQSIGGFSECPKCKHQLHWHNLVPLFSYLFQGMKCQYCKDKISPRYFFIELITGLLFVAAAWYFLPFTPLSVIGAIKLATIIAVCIVVFSVDFEHYLILDRVVLPAAVLMLILNVALDLAGGFYAHSFYAHSLPGIIAGALAFIPFWGLWKFSKGLWMGFGDAKFVLFMGIALGFPGILVSLFLSFTIGAIIGIALIGLGSKKLSSRLPFGTFLSVATVVTAIYGERLWDIYWNLFI